MSAADANQFFIMAFGFIGVAVVIAVLLIGAGVRWAWKKWIKKGVE